MREFEPPPPPPGAPRRSRIPCLVFALFLLLLVGGALAFVWHVVKDMPGFDGDAESGGTDRWSRGVQEIAGEPIARVGEFLDAVGASRDEDAWNLTSADFRGQTSRAAFGELAARVRREAGACSYRTVRSASHRTNGAEPDQSLLVYKATFEKGEGSITFDLDKPGAEWLVRSWTTYLRDSDLVLTGGAPRPVVRKGR